MRRKKKPDTNRYIDVDLKDGPERIRIKESFRLFWTKCKVCGEEFAFEKMIKCGEAEECACMNCFEKRPEEVKSVFSMHIDGNRRFQMARNGLGAS